ncbi:MAG TPA: hypothetical protein VE567_03630, partial [Sphingomonas sp.]|nr:hypothetical protein [Sphingomonas sp.]
MGQIIVANVATFIAAAILVPIVSTRLLDRVAVKYQRLALRTQADGIADELRSQPGKNLSLPRGANLDLNFADAFAGHSFAVLAQNGEVLLASGETGVTLQTAPRANRTVFFRRGPILSVSLPADISGRRCWIIASHDLRSPGAISDDIVGGFSSRLLLLLAPTFALLLLLNLFLVWGTVTAIQRASRVAESIGSADHDRRVHPGSLPMEIAPLAEAMNGALDRLQSSLRSRSAFIANVAHELRTPLATFKLKLE